MPSVPLIPAPGISSLEDLKAVTDALDRPFNVLGVGIPGATLASLQAAGAQRVSIGGTLPFVGAKPILESCEAMLTEGTFDWVANMAPYGTIMDIMNREAP